MFRSSGQDVDQLIARGKYAKAIKMLREQLAVEKSAFKLQQLADLLALEGQPREALQILSRLVEDMADRGFMSKAIAILKKMKRIKPDLEGLDEKYAELVRKRAEHNKQSPVPAAVTPAPAKGEAIELAPADPNPVDAVGMRPAPLQESTGGADIDSVLFRDFSDEELTVFIQGLDLHVFEAGQIICTEGQPGDGLYVLANGTLRVYVRNGQGCNEQVRLMGPGEFFGEISLLTGSPRTATIVATGHVELLALDMRRLTEMARRHPSIPEILKEVARRRHNSPEEKSARGC